MTAVYADTCPILLPSGTPCGSALRWEVTPEGADPYVCCGQHVTAPILSMDEPVPFSARPVG
ncbi:hypothetical protein HUT18_21280 [Streptomyces sp. NA04227]|uniref:hypothetical protein n=1 Tax=Streptomyces sp. NA04227 TaxID=2742136 RepID=UPI0015926FA8|nr:hypothetical protein [Streptomyces sp. NA04227]QKW08521.1 hypothetical protein HUT18_21280 [Streptomyces sp. NA04227]